MPRTADSGATGDSQAATQGSFPPPPPRPASRSTPQATVPPATDAARESARTAAEAEALAKVAMLSSRSAGDGGPSRAIVATALGMGVLLVALLLLAIIVSIGPDPAATSVR